MTFTPTPEQQAIVTAATETKDNLLISALAGAAKTSTLVLIAHALPATSILCLAFNKRIADEMKSRLPTNCDSMTLNSLGHRAWAQYLGTRLNLDTKKTFRLLSEVVNALPAKDKTEAFKIFADLMRNIDFGKSCGYIPSGHFPAAKGGLMGDEEFFAHLEDKPSRLEENIIREVTIASLGEAVKGTIDFADQLLMPTLFPSIFPFYPLVLVDEAQDLSALNHAMLAKLAKKRLIAVGDECQSIYGFRGAHQNGMEVLKERFKMSSFTLSISFRCPITVVEEARWRAPHMQYPEWAEMGDVQWLSIWSIDNIPAGDTAIICRNNAPLFTMAIRMLRDGRYPELVGNDLGKSLIKQLKKLGAPSLKQSEVIDLINEWRKAKLAKSRNPARVHDHAACLMVFAEEGTTLADAITYAERVMAVAGPTKLMTGHKSKGLEFTTVLFLDQDLVGHDDEQEKNLRYVIQTRTKGELLYVDSKNYLSGKEPGDE